MTNFFIIFNDINFDNIIKNVFADKGNCDWDISDESWSYKK